MPCNKKRSPQHPYRRAELITSGGGLLFYEKIKARSAREMVNGKTNAPGKKTAAMAAANDFI